MGLSFAQVHLLMRKSVFRSLSSRTGSEFYEHLSIDDRHKAGIINAIETVANNARAERLNGAIQELKTIGRGYKNIENFRVAILFFYGDFKMAPH